jgi:hypothetical protein
MQIIERKVPMSRKAISTGIYAAAMILCLAFGCPNGAVAAMVDETRWKADDMRMYLVRALGSERIQAISDSSGSNMVSQITKWSSKPLELRAQLHGDDCIRVRIEPDFLILWYHSFVSAIPEDALPLDTIRLAVQRMLAKEYVPGDANAVGWPGKSEVPAQQIYTFNQLRSLPNGAGTVGCYSANGTLEWGPISSVQVLVRHRDIFIAIEKGKARQLGPEGPIPPYVYEGIATAKAKPALARNLLLTTNGDASGIPEALLNACTWPTDDKEVSGAISVISIRDLVSSSARECTK